MKDYTAHSRRPTQCTRQMRSSDFRRLVPSYGNQAASTNNSWQGHEWRNGQNRFAVLSDMEGMGEAVERPEVQSWNIQNPSPSTHGISSAAFPPVIKGLADQVSSMTVGTGGHACTTIDQPFPASHSSTDDQNHGYVGWLETGVPAVPDGCVNPQSLVLNVQDWDEACRHTLNVPDVAFSFAPAPMPSELEDVPFAYARPAVNFPWTPEQNRSDTSFDGDTFEQESTSSRTHADSQVWTSNLRGTGTTNTTWGAGPSALGIDITDPSSSHLIPGHGNIPASPTPSEISITPSIVPPSLVCDVDNCRVEFNGAYRRGNLARHIRILHERRQYRCGVLYCKKVFRRQDALKKHFDKKHRRP